MNKQQERILDLFENTIQSGVKYESPLKDLDFYKLFYKAGADDNLHNLMGCNLCMFNYDFNGEDAVLICFGVPMNMSEGQGMKNVSEKVMSIIEILENLFIRIDSLTTKTNKLERFVYITAIKKIN